MILVLSGNNGTCEGDSYPFDIPFEYDSKEAFIFDVLEGKINVYDQLEGVFYNKDQLQYIEKDVYTLEEWLNNNLIKL